MSNFHLLSICIFVIIFTISPFVCSAQVLEKRISIEFKKENLGKVLTRISEKGNFNFSYNSKFINPDKSISGKYKDEKIGVILRLIIADPSIEFKELNNLIIFHNKKSPKKVTSATQVDILKIKGKVIDQNTKKGIDDVHVFIANSTIGATTNQEGYFELNNSIEGNFELVFSHIAYLTIVRSNNNLDLKSDPLLIELTPHETQLEVVEFVDDKDKEWENNFKLFKDAFLGNTNYSSKCEILNPWVLDFKVEEQTKKITAKASDLILLENKKTGYKVSIYLKLFELVNGKPKYLYKSFFEELTPLSFAQKKRWKKAREFAYKGSLKHFISSLYSGNLKSEGFKILLSKNLIRGDASSEVSKQIKLKDIVESTEQGKQLTFNDYLQITYFKGSESIKYVKYLQAENFDKTELRLQPVIDLKPLHQKSWLKITPQKNKNLKSENSLITNHRTIRISDKLQILNPLDIEQFGYWAWKRVADELPNDFFLQK